MNSSRFAIILVVAIACAVSPPVYAQDPPVSVTGLGDGRFAKMTALVEKTFLRFDAYWLSIRFGEDTAEDLEALARGQEYSEERARAIAQEASQAKNAYARVVFQRDISFDQFLDGVRDNLKKARDAGMIRPTTYRMVSQGLPKWFSFLEDRGIREGEQLLYRAQGDKLRTVYLDNEGHELLDQTNRGVEHRRASLAGYFAPGVDAREPLIRSLFKR